MKKRDNIWKRKRKKVHDERRSSTEKDRGKQKGIKDYFKVSNEELHKERLIELNDIWDSTMVKEYKLRPSRAKTITDKVRILDNAAMIWERYQKNTIPDIKCAGEEGAPLTLNEATPPLENFDKPPVMVGGDVQALYPSLDVVTTSRLAARAVEETDIEIKGVDYHRLSVCLTITLGPGAMMKHGLEKAIARGCENSKAESLASKTNRDLTGWKNDYIAFDRGARKKMLSLFTQILTIILMTSHCYSFGGKLFI